MGKFFTVLLVLVFLGVIGFLGYKFNDQVDSCPCDGTYPCPCTVPHESNDLVVNPDVSVVDPVNSDISMNKK